MSAVIKIAVTAESAPDSGQGRMLCNTPLSVADSVDNSEIRSLLEEAGELPDISDRNRLFLFPVDPYQIFSCWTIRKADIDIISQRIGRKYKRLNLVLRFFDITGIAFDGNNANAYFDIQVDPAAETSYVPLWQTGRRYIADLGFSNEYGIFYPVCRSNVADMPPGPFADRKADYHTPEISASGLSEKIDLAFMPGISSHTSVSDK